MTMPPLPLEYHGRDAGCQVLRQHRAPPWPQVPPHPDPGQRSARVRRLRPGPPGRDLAHGRGARPHPHRRQDLRHDRLRHQRASLLRAPPHPAQPIAVPVLGGRLLSARVCERLVFSQGLPAVGAGGFVGAVWVEDDLLAPAVDAGPAPRGLPRLRLGLDMGVTNLAATSRRRPARLVLANEFPAGRRRQTGRNSCLAKRGRWSVPPIRSRAQTAGNSTGP